MNKIIFLRIIVFFSIFLFLNISFFLSIIKDDFFILGDSNIEFNFDDYQYNFISNNPPNIPNIPSGPTERNIGQPGSYSTFATDPDGDLIQYRFDWHANGTHDYSEWTNLDSSGHIGWKNHVWGIMGIYTVKAQSRDEFGLISNWSEGLIVTVNIPNNKPYTPTLPAGPTERNIGQPGSYSTFATDPDGDLIQYRFDWHANGTHDYSEWTPFNISGHIGSYLHSWNNEGIYVVKAQARDIHGKTSSWSNGLSVVISELNNPPYKPVKPSGKINGNIRNEYEYNTYTIDPDNDQIFYMWNWSDEISNWEGPYDSGVSITVKHKFEYKGSYEIRVKSKDIYDNESPWSEPLIVSMSKKRNNCVLTIHLIEF